MWRNANHCCASCSQDVFDLVESHFAARGKERELAATMEDRVQQFRSVQKRLLVRFKVWSAPARPRSGLQRSSRQSACKLFVCSTGQQCFQQSLLPH